MAGSGLCPGLGRQVGNGEIELPSAQQLLILHEAVHILGAVVVGLGELVVASHEVLLEFFVIFLELGVLVRRHRVVLLPLHDPASNLLVLVAVVVDLAAFPSLLRSIVHHLAHLGVAAVVGFLGVGRLFL